MRAPCVQIAKKGTAIYSRIALVCSITIIYSDDSAITIIRKIMLLNIIGCPGGSINMAAVSAKRTMKTEMHDSLLKLIKVLCNIRTLLSCYQAILYSIGQ